MPLLRFREKYRPGKIFEDGDQRTLHKRNNSLSSASISISESSPVQSGNDGDACEESQERDFAEAPQASKETLHKSRTPSKSLSIQQGNKYKR